MKIYKCCLTINFLIAVNPTIKISNRDLSHHLLNINIQHQELHRRYNIEIKLCYQFAEQIFKSETMNICLMVGFSVTGLRF